MTSKFPPPPLRPWAPLIVNAALTGMIPMPERVPYVPITPEDIADQAAACVAAGATVVHLHARDEDGVPTWRREAYERFIPAIRERCPEAVICVTTSGRNWPELERRTDVLRLEGDAKPDMASLTLGSLNFKTGASTNDPATIDALAAAMAERGIRPELEVFDLGMAYAAHGLLERGLVEPPLYANVLLGNPYTAPATPGALSQLVDALPDGTQWAAAGIGAYQLPMNALGVFTGGHVRTGLEDNPHYDQGERSPATNEALVRRVTELARIAGRPLARPAEARSMLGLPPAAGLPTSPAPWSASSRTTSLE